MSSFVVVRKDNFPLLFFPLRGPKNEMFPCYHDETTRDSCWHTCLYNCELLEHPNQCINVITLRGIEAGEVIAKCHLSSLSEHPLICELNANGSANNYYIKGMPCDILQNLQHSFTPSCALQITIENGQTTAILIALVEILPYQAVTINYYLSGIICQFELNTCIPQSFVDYSIAPKDNQLRVSFCEKVILWEYYIDKSELPERVCFCRRPAMAKLLVGCDSCFEWYHAECIKMSAEEAESIETYICDKCKLQSEKKPRNTVLENSDQPKRRRERSKEEKDETSIHTTKRKKH
jgi:hypothetical protein